MKRRPWNYGLTKETDIRVANYGINSSLTKQREGTARGINNSNYGKNWSKEHKKLISLRVKNAMKRPEVLRKISKTWFKIGQLNPHTKEQNQKIAIKHLGIKVSDNTRKKISLSHGGTGTPYENSDYPQEFSKSLKEQIRKRDNYTCQICGVIENKEKHSIHHIDYNKKNCSLDNLISLCRKCHVKTNFNREQWKKVFK